MISERATTEPQYRAASVAGMYGLCIWVPYQE